MQTMRLKLNQGQLDLQAKFTQKLAEAINNEEKPKRLDDMIPFFCKECDSFLFRLGEVQAHIPVFMS